MNKLAKGLYGINGITCIFIGSLHIFAHYQDLITEEVQTLLNHEILVSGNPASIWGLWQGMSLMMGFLLIIVGLLNLLILYRLAPKKTPPIEASLIMMLMLIGVMYTGYYFFGAWQVYGGGAGFLLQSICLFFSLKK